MFQDVYHVQPNASQLECKDLTKGIPPVRRARRRRGSRRSNTDNAKWISSFVSTLLEVFASFGVTDEPAGLRRVRPSLAAIGVAGLPCGLAAPDANSPSTLDPRLRHRKNGKFFRVCRSPPSSKYFVNLAHHIAATYPSCRPGPGENRPGCQIALQTAASCAPWVRFCSFAHRQKALGLVISPPFRGPPIFSVKPPEPQP